MPFTSAQISQMLGGQQTMFANQAAFAHNVGAQAGLYPGNLTPITPPSFGPGITDTSIPGVTNSSPGGWGAAAVGGLGASLPGAAAGLGLAGGFGLLGHAGGYLDPFTGVGRSFLGGFRSVGGLASFGQGAGAGLGAIGAGVSAAMLPAAGYYAAGRAISHVGGQIYEGAQNISQVGTMAGQYFGPQYGAPGARLGGGMARGQIQEITSVLHEIAGQDTLTSFKDLKQLMDRAGQFGLLTGIQSASEFKTKFQKIVGQAKDVAMMLNTTLEEGLGTVSSFRSMGMWTAQDVMGGAMALKTVGPQGRGALLGAMQSGAQRSHAMGGSLAAGSSLARNQVLNMQAMVQSGLISGEMVTELTGGTGGVEGQAMLADRITNALQSMAYTSVGRLSMAGLGETKDGRFTGRIDPKLLKRMQEGDLSIGDLQGLGRGKASTREGAASFTYRQEQLGQELMSQGGLELMGGMLQSGLSRAGLTGASDDIQGIMLQKLTGMNARDAQMMQKILRELPRMQEARSRKELAVLRDTLTLGEERRNRSWEGLKDVIAHGWEETAERPLQQLAEGIATRWNESVDSISAYLEGRIRQTNMTSQERMRLLYQRGSRPSAQALSAMQTFIGGSLESSLSSNFIRRGGEGRQGFLMGTGAAILSSLGYETGLGTRASDLMASGARANTATGAQGELLVSSVGNNYAISADEARRATEAIRLRGSVPKQTELFKESTDVTQALTTVRYAYQSVLTSINGLQLEKLKKSMSPAQYNEALSRAVRMKGGPELQRAFDILHHNRLQEGKTTLDTRLDAMAAVQADSAWKEHYLQANFGAAASTSGANLAALLQDGAAFSQEIDQRLNDVLEQASGVTTYNKTGDARGNFRDVGFTGRQLRDFVEGGQAGDELVQFLKSGTNNYAPYPALAKEIAGNSSLRQFLMAVSKSSPEERAAIGKSMSGADAMKMGKLYAQSLAERGDLAERELRGGGADEKYASVLELYKKAGAIGSRDVVGGDQLSAAADAANLAYAKDLAARHKQKGTGNVIGDFRKRGGAFADHTADLAQLELLNVAGMGGSSILSQLRARGLDDEYAQAGVVAPDEKKKFDELIQKGGKFTKDQSRDFADLLKKVEKAFGAQESKGARQVAEERMLDHLNKFVGASQEFVVAVRTAVPSLGELSAGKLLETARKFGDKPTEVKTP